MFVPLTEAPSGPDHDDHDHRVFLVRGDQVLVETGGDGAARPLHIDAARTVLNGAVPHVVLGRLHRTVYWVAELPEHAELGANHRLDGLRGLHGHLDDAEWNIGGRATQLWDWQRDHRFCGRCGNAMERAPGERAMRCSVDGNLAYPRLSPAVIVLVTNDKGHALLGRSARWDTPMYSTLAGFVEPGESLEETVHREIHEEAGVHVKDVEYFASQPWPFPNSLMLGFTARWAAGDIEVDGEEIADAQWFAPDDLPMIPPKLSIARRLIDHWLGDL